MSIDTAEAPPRSSLSRAAARNLATTTKTAPQMRAITPRWLLRMLPWAQVSGGTYRVNRRLTDEIGGGRVTFARTATELRVVPPSLREIPVLAGLDDEIALEALAQRFVQVEVEAGTPIVTRGRAADGLYLVAHGRVRLIGAGEYGTEAALGVMAEGDYFGDDPLPESDGVWEYTAVAATACTVLVLSRHEFQDALGRLESLSRQIRQFQESRQKPQNRRGEADITLVSGHTGEPALPLTYADYELAPREYELGVAQTVLRVHSRVADLYNGPMDQVGQQLRLAVEALRERQEHEMLNNREFGLLHNVARAQRIRARTGPPTPDDLDDLLTRRRGTRLILAHPQAIAAFGRECSRRGVHPAAAEVQGTAVTTWRGVPMFPCDKIPISGGRTSTILAMRTGEDDEGVVGLRQMGIPDEYEPSLNVRFMGIDGHAVISYLVSAYFSVAVLVPDALGALEGAEISHPS